MTRNASAFALIAAPLLLFAPVSAEAQRGQGNGQGGPNAQADEPTDIYRTLQTDPRFSIFAEVVQAAGLHNNMRNGGDFTVFAPINEAFEALPADQLADLRSASNREANAVVVRRHMMRRPMRRADARARSFFELRTLAGNNTYITINRDDSAYMDSGRIMEFDIEATNGVVHVLEHVLLPE
jgi:uncharacterized surface protein with fasciclin (FAS1) repeats